MRPNILDVAKYSGVSTATVSRVLNNNCTIRPSTRKKVEEAIEAIGYKLPESKNMVRVVEKKLVVVLVPNIGDSYFSSILNGIITSLPNDVYQVVLRSTQGDISVEGTYLDMLEEGQISGVISLCPIFDPLTNLDRIARLPWVICSNYLKNSGASVVSIDYEQAAKDAVLYLLSKGHRKIALVNSSENNIQAQQKTSGYIAAMKRAGVSVDDSFIQLMTSDDYKSGELSARRLMTLSTPPTAILAASDQLAIGVVKAILGMNKMIPEDISIIGFDGLPISEIFEPSITTITQLLSEIGTTSANEIKKRIYGGKAEDNIIQHTLKIRQSA